MTDGEIVEILREFVRRDLLKDPDYPLRADEPLVSGGLIDSFMITHLAVFVEQRFGVNVPDVVLLSEKMDSLDRIAAFVRASRGGG